MYIREGKLQTIKDLKFEQFYEKLRSVLSIEDEKDINIAYHFRIGTSGKINKDNIHPFVTRSGIGLMQNGILPEYGDKERCDTKHFVEDIIDKLPEGWELNNAILSLIGTALSITKTVIMLPTKVVIFNSKAWDTDNGIMYSNTSYKIKRTEMVIHDSYNTGYTSPRQNNRYNNNYLFPDRYSGRNYLNSQNNGQYSEKCMYCHSPLYLDTEKRNNSCIDCPKHCRECAGRLESFSEKNANICDNCSVLGFGNDREFDMKGYFYE